MSDTPETRLTLPLVEERASIDKQTVETARIRVRTVMDQKLERVSEELARDEVTIEHVPIDREVAEAPPIRQEGDVLIVPVLEEVLVVEKRLVLKEELWIRKQHKRERFEQAVTLRRMRAEVERTPSPPPEPDTSRRSRDR